MGLFSRMATRKGEYHTSFSRDPEVNAGAIKLYPQQAKPRQRPLQYWICS